MTDAQVDEIERRNFVNFFTCMSEIDARVRVVAYAGINGYSRRTYNNMIDAFNIAFDDPFDMTPRFVR